MPRADMRKSPSEYLRQIQRERRGSLKLFLGAAPGVGKTYSMLREANEMLDNGLKVVIGIIETHGRHETQNQIGNLPVLPLKQITYKDRVFEELDLEGILARRPPFVIVDELAHTNVPGSKNAKRYEDVLELLDAGIHVISAMNIQHLESLNDTVEQLTSVQVRERVPDWILATADEIQLIDTPPEKLRERLVKGLIYRPEKVELALRNFFRLGNLNALRELALRAVADDVDDRLESYKQEHGIDGMIGASEKILVCVQSGRSAERLIRRGWRIASRLKCELMILHVPSQPVHAFDEATRQKLRSVEQLAQDLGAAFHIEALGGRKTAQVIIEFVERMGITQIVLGQSARSRWDEIVKGSIINKILKETRYVDVLIVADGNDSHRA